MNAVVHSFEAGEKLTAPAIGPFGGFTLNTKNAHWLFTHEQIAVLRACLMECSCRDSNPGRRDENPL